MISQIHIIIVPVVAHCRCSFSVCFTFSMLNSNCRKRNHRNPGSKSVWQSIAASGIVEPQSENIAIGSRTFWRGARGVCSRR